MKDQTVLEQPMSWLEIQLLSLVSFNEDWPDFAKKPELKKTWLIWGSTLSLLFVSSGVSYYIVNNRLYDNSEDPDVVAISMLLPVMLFCMNMLRLLFMHMIREWRHHLIFINLLKSMLAIAVCALICSLIPANYQISMLQSDLNEYESRKTRIATMKDQQADLQVNLEDVSSLITDLSQILNDQSTQSITDRYKRLIEQNNNLQQEEAKLTLEINSLESENREAKDRLIQMLHK